MPSSDFTSRPATKRVRSDQDHSKAGVKAQKSKEDGDSRSTVREDDDWQAQPPYQVGETWEGWETKWRQSCWCGKTAFVFNDDPASVKYCHCEDCQRLHGAPFQHAAIFHKKNVRLDSSAEWLGFLSAHGDVHPLSSTPTPLPRKTSCRACGSPLFDEGRKMCIAFPPTFEFARTGIEAEKSDKHQSDQSKNGGGPGVGLHGKGTEGGKQVGLPPSFEASCHIFYERRVMDIKDGLPKWRAQKEGSELMGEDQRP